ncbi:hypothetical protein SDC9_133451 [bioreactor metagenome]|uniref:Uncharacterized protein n=1 Tax=bioreactor metagenome TaxID=1076179 RepID=A0A645DCR8_9ZZZZ
MGWGDSRIAPTADRLFLELISKDEKMGLTYKRYAINYFLNRDSCTTINRYILTFTYKLNGDIYEKNRLGLHSTWACFIFIRLYVSASN